LPVVMQALRKEKSCHLLTMGLANTWNYSHNTENATPDKILYRSSCANWLVTVCVTSYGYLRSIRFTCRHPIHRCSRFHVWPIWPVIVLDGRSKVIDIGRFYGLGAEDSVGVTRTKETDCTDQIESIHCMASRLLHSCNILDNSACVR
jgi:hypothetical protein